MRVSVKESSEEITNSFPKILQLNKGGEAVDWITYEDAACHYAKGNVLWSLGTHEIEIRGGTNAKTGLRSMFAMDTIIAINEKSSSSKFLHRVPSLSNNTLFQRDESMCAYCNRVCKRSILTRDHVNPQSRGGKDVWNNVVTACYGCNQMKGAKTPEEADMPLLYVPYTPNWSENLILKNRNILVDQMEFLMRDVPKHSRLHKN